MKTLICIPALDTVHTMFFQSMEALRRPAGTSVSISSSSLVYDARNKLAQAAIDGGYDRVLWLDTDMRFNPDLIERFNADIDAGMEMVCGLFFCRRAPVLPCIYHSCTIKDGMPSATAFDEIGDEPFPVQACGFAGVMMTGDLLRRVSEKFGQPFSPGFGFGEDLSFCLRAGEMGAKIWCDPRVKMDHIGYAVINETTWRAMKG